MGSLKDGTIFARRYRITRRIAGGSMGAVFEAVHIETERRHALKVMHPHTVDSEELRDRFRREARVAAQIDSEYIVDVVDAGVDDETKMPFLVMELLRGEELGDHLARVGRLAPDQAAPYLWQTALALEKTHAANIVHRDLKPPNLFLAVRKDGSTGIKILDFGVAKFVVETNMSGTQSLGTPIYMAPEQFRADRVSSATDNFALAMVAYAMLVGEAYWAPEARGVTDVVGFAMTAAGGPIEAASVRAARSGVTLPSGFDAWFSKATAREPSRRFAQATAMIEAFARVFGLGLPPRHSSGTYPAASQPAPVSAPGAAPAPPAQPPQSTPHSGSVHGLVLQGGGAPLGGKAVLGRPKRTTLQGTMDPVTPKQRRRGRSALHEIPAHILAAKGTSTTEKGTVKMDEHAKMPSHPPAPSQPVPVPRPAAPSNPPQAPTLSVEQFAWLVATVESVPSAAVDEVLARMRITRQQYASISSAWQLELARNPPLAARYSSALALERSRRGAR